MHLPTLTTEAAELHADALEASRVAELCQAASGQRLDAIKRALGPGRWMVWLNQECPIPKAKMGEYITVAGRR